MLFTRFIALTPKLPIAMATVFKHYLCILVCQHGVYLENSMAGSNQNGFAYVNCEIT